jgi:hydrogenase maturation protease
VSKGVLVYGYGNPGRLDDGLGPALVNELARLGPVPDLRLETAYQLQVEDAALVSAYPVVVFADACAVCAAPYELRRIAPRDELEFSTHAVSPEAVLALARRHFGAEPEALLLGIRGYEFDGFGEQLSMRAARNLQAALAFVRRWLVAQRGSVPDARSGRGEVADVRS